MNDRSVISHAAGLSPYCKRASPFGSAFDGINEKGLTAALLTDRELIDRYNMEPRRDLAVGLRTNMPTAEKIKIDHGLAHGRFMKTSIVSAFAKAKTDPAYATAHSLALPRTRPAGSAG